MQTARCNTLSVFVYSRVNASMAINTWYSTHGFKMVSRAPKKRCWVVWFASDSWIVGSRFWVIPAEYCKLPNPEAPGRKIRSVPLIKIWKIKQNHFRWKIQHLSASKSPGQLLNCSAPQLGHLSSAPAPRPHRKGPLMAPHRGSTWIDPALNHGFGGMGIHV